MPARRPFLDRGSTVLAFAHRGGARHPDLLGVENTLLAFEHASALGYRYLETDVHLTADGALLAFHDTMLDRVTDRSGPVATRTLADVRTLRVGGRGQVPTLDELFDRLPQARFNIDIKADAAVVPLARFIEARNAWDRVLVASFSHRSLRGFRALTAGRVATSASPTELGLYLAGRQAGAWDALQVPVSHRLLGRTVHIVTEQLVQRAHRDGRQVHVWTIDDPAEMNALIDLGVDGLFTDRTDVLKDVLVARGQWAP